MWGWRAWPGAVGRWVGAWWSGGWRLRGTKLWSWAGHAVRRAALCAASQPASEPALEGPAPRDDAACSRHGLLPRAQLAEAERELKRIRFEEALASPEEGSAIDKVVLDDMHVDDSYDGPRMDSELGSRACLLYPLAVLCVVRVVRA